MMTTEETVRAALHDQAIRAYGEQRSAQLEPRLAQLAGWIALIEQQPLDLLDEDPDDGR